MKIQNKKSLKKKKERRRKKVKKTKETIQKRSNWKMKQR